MLKYDVIIVGAGSAGISCAYNSAKLGLKTLLVEKNIHSGGLITSGLVIPAMKLEHKGINIDFYNDLITYSRKYHASITYGDNNQGWFNPELLKFVFEKMLIDIGCDILYNSQCVETKHNDNKFILVIKSNMLSIHIETSYLVDGTGDGEIFRQLNLKFLENENKKLKQSTSLRFIASGIDRKIFSDWILQLDKDRDVTTAYEIDNEWHFSTAYTWDTTKKWALKPYFDDAISKGVLNDADSAYFQIFSVPKTCDAVAFNCPRLVNDADNDDIFTQTKLIIQGRERINRIVNFCKLYLKGFEKAYVSNISDMLGVRESARVYGKKVFTLEDIKSGIIPKNIALASNYPVDVHSDKKNDGCLDYTKHIWYLPLEALMSRDYDNLFVIGRCLSADFYAQAAVRTQVNCFSMGEAVAKHIQNLSK